MSELRAALRPWLRHHVWCNCKTDDLPDTERCKCGLRAALRSVPDEGLDARQSPNVEALAEARWAVLAWLGADAKMRDDFLRVFATDDGGFGIEYRFMGMLGFGGKYHRQRGREWISCYAEDETPDRLMALAHANNMLTALARLAEQQERPRE